MVCIIKSVSLSEEESLFLQDYNLSPSQLLKEKIWEMRGMLKTIADNKIARMAKVIQDQAHELEKLRKNVLEEQE